MRPQSALSIVTCILTCVIGIAPSASAEADSNTSPNAQGRSQQNAAAVREWFDNYDQIRRDAEMSLADKYQARFLTAKKPREKNAELASKMLQKYKAAATALSALTPTPETKDLQAGYLEYFTTARQLFEDYLAAQSEVPFSNDAFAPTKKSLEDLDRRNKILDQELREQFNIAKHKHS